MNLKALFTACCYGAKDSVQRVFGKVVPPRQERMGVGDAKNFNAVGENSLIILLSLEILSRMNPFSTWAAGWANGYSVNALSLQAGRILRFRHSQGSDPMVPDNITARFPNFHFALSDIYNTRQRGKHAPSQFVCISI